MATTGTSSPGRVNNAGNGPVRGTSAPGRVHNPNQSDAETARLSRKPNTNQATNTNASNAPANASDAPSGNTAMVFTGLADALNQFQKDLVKQGTYEVPDQYEIVFAPALLAQSKVALKGTTAYKATPMAQSQTPGVQANTKTDRMDTTSRAVQVLAGTQIVQFIDQVMRSSDYITKQANVTIVESSGKLIPNSNTKGKSTGFKWYKINFTAQQLAYDGNRNDYAYKLIYIVSEYLITDMQSEFFSPGKFRGVHKSYSYWFTGQNTDVLNFEQSYNNTYFQVLTSSPDGTNPGGLIPVGITNKSPDSKNNMPAPPKHFAPGLGQSSQYADNGANKVSASAADFLYSLTNQASAKLDIVGDPAWLAQGEVTNSLTADTMTWSPFLSKDGAINIEAGQVLFNLIFNRPSDYDFNTGIVDVNAQTYKGAGTNPGSLSLMQPQAHLTYVATRVKSTFSRGQFKQELEGKVYLQAFDDAINQAKSDQNERIANRRDEEANSMGVRQPDRYDPSFDDANAGIQGVDDPNSDPNTNTGSYNQISNPANQTQAPAEPPTSNGGINNPNVDPNTNIGAEAQDTNPYALRTLALMNKGEITEDPVAQIQVSTNLQIMAPGDDA
jgi:hypothetical protein